MIEIFAGDQKHIVEPSMFPDGTSQIWKLPAIFMERSKDHAVTIVWWFQNEREIVDVLQLAELFVSDDYHPTTLHMPWLPYGRQDKEIANDATFSGSVIIQLLCDSFDIVTTVDAHSNSWPLKSYGVSALHKQACEEFKPDIIVSPDQGARDRYILPPMTYPPLIFEKTRDQLTGKITGLEIKYGTLAGDRYLIIDDICDGGATFVAIAKRIRQDVPKAIIALFVTHGIFSKGLPLEGIDWVGCSNSLIQHSGSRYKV